MKIHELIEQKDALLNSVMLNRGNIQQEIVNSISIDLITTLVWEIYDFDRYGNLQLCCYDIGTELSNLIRLAGEYKVTLWFKEDGIRLASNTVGHARLIGDPDNVVSCIKKYDLQIDYSSLDSLIKEQVYQLDMLKSIRGI